MTDFTTHSIETAPAESRSFLETARRAYGFVPNLLGTMATAPALLEGYMTLAGIFEKSDLSETERQIILMTNNRVNGCVFCMAAHSTLAQMKGVPADVIEALRSGSPIGDARLEALRQFAIVINQSRGWPSGEQIEALLAAGYTRQTVLEVILGTALKTLSNYTNHIASTELDSVFATQAWSDTARIAAE